MHETLIKELRTSGMVLWVESDRVKGCMYDKSGIPLALRLKAVELRDIGVAAVEALGRVGDAYYLEGLPPEDALKIGRAIKDGNAIRLGRVVIHRSTGLFDITFVPLEGWANDFQEKRQ